MKTGGARIAWDGEGMGLNYELSEGKQKYNACSFSEAALRTSMRNIYRASKKGVDLVGMFDNLSEWCVSPCPLPPDAAHCIMLPTTLQNNNVKWTANHKANVMDTTVSLSQIYIKLLLIILAMDFDKCHARLKRVSGSNYISDSTYHGHSNSINLTAFENNVCLISLYWMLKAVI